ncbi:BZ3500_MvSof-1268-A1-R1_Chr3-1g05706 [Microbotryum saponariae]|uniref:BZ3500_MvSof-1268-A1-R1_Chr3-1g05706 protein n=1 Tax=Microbotryum saponariae TaxID=289078 RepID=A0A2X0NH51_9BASI|nr:BZ3500_MvSof-1268-A1-R1_Chr3-1g05706 [Microbotryum saponariae]SDA04896.1 BZ3501_MvSof-1269-A2-R1_Chr3-1g05376 [Microbotryum saponariae]
MQRSLLRPLSRSMRAGYATHAPSSAAAAAAAATPAATASPSERYDPEEDPQLADMGYPKLYTTSRQLRSPRGWWDNQERINFGEPAKNDDIQSMWAPDVHSIKPSSALLQLATMFGVLGLFAGTVYFLRPAPPAMPRTYPTDPSERAIHARPDSANEIED